MNQLIVRLHKTPGYRRPFRARGQEVYASWTSLCNKHAMPSHSSDNEFSYRDCTNHDRQDNNDNPRLQGFTWSKIPCVILLSNYIAKPVISHKVWEDRNLLKILKFPGRIASRLTRRFIQTWNWFEKNRRLEECSVLSSNSWDECHLFKKFHSGRKMTCVKED